MATTKTDGFYPMRMVERLTGLTAGTIRTWERRYGAVTPERSAGNTRRFSGKQVERLNLLRQAIDAGHSIGAIAQFDDDRLRELVQDEAPTEEAASPSPAAPSPPPDASLLEWRDRYLDAINQFDVRGAQTQLTRAAMLLDPEPFVDQVAIPILHEVSLRWADGSFPAALEHLVTQQVSGALQRMLETQPFDDHRPRIVLSSPPNHQHEFGILIAALSAAIRGVEPVYLGPNLPLQELSWAVRTSRSDALVLGVVRDLAPEEVEDLPSQLELMANWTTLWIGCPTNHELVQLVPSARFFHDFEDFRRSLVQLARG